MSVCVAERVRSRAIWLHCITSQRGPGSHPGAGPANQAVHPSGVGKVVAISIQHETPFNGCDGKACCCRIAGVRLTHVGFVLSARASLEVACY
jgi:hypothetical protein